MKKYIIYFLFPFLLSNLYAQEKKEEKKEIKRHSFVAEETFLLTENTIQNLAKWRYKRKTGRLEQLVESSSDFIKTSNEVKRKLFRAHYKLDYTFDIKKTNFYTFFDTDYQGSARKVGQRSLYLTCGGGMQLKFVKLDIGYGLKIVDKATILNVFGSSIEAEKKINKKLGISGSISLKQPLKEKPRKPSVYMELASKYKLAGHFNGVISYTWIHEKPKNITDSWKKYALRFGFGFEN